MSKKLSRSAQMLFVLIMISLLFIFPDKTFESVSASWERCTASLLPSLFPMSVLSKQICPYLFFGKSRFSAFLSKLSGFSERELPVFLISLLCGYPIPSVVAKDMADSGALTKEEAQKVIALCNNASPSFLIFFVGQCIFNSQAFGVALYLCQALSVAVIAHFKKVSQAEFRGQKALHESLSESVVRSAKSIVVLFGFVIFFSLAGDLAKNVASKLGTPPIFGVILSGIFESTSGIAGISNLPFATKLPLICFFASFGGLSVFFQVRASAGADLMDVREYLAARLAVFAGSLFFLFPYIFYQKALYFDAFA